MRAFYLVLLFLSRLAALALSAPDVKHRQRYASGALRTLCLAHRSLSAAEASELVKAYGPKPTQAMASGRASPSAGGRASPSSPSLYASAAAAAAPAFLVPGTVLDLPQSAWDKLDANLTLDLLVGGRMAVVVVVVVVVVAAAAAAGCYRMINDRLL